MGTSSSSMPIREVPPHATRSRLRRSPSIHEPHGGPDAPDSDAAAHRQERAGEHASESWIGHGLDRDGTDQLAAALLSLFQMHRLSPGDAERATLRAAVITEYMPYARYVAARYGARGRSAEDFVRAAYVGLVKAVDNFDPDFGAAFLTFATSIILGELKRCFPDTTWALQVPRQVPRRVQELRSEVRDATETLSKRLNRVPTVEELAALLAADPAEVVDAIDATGLHAVTSLDAPITSEEEGGSALSDLVGDDCGLHDMVDRETLRRLLATLSTREKKILLMRFLRRMTQTEISKELGVSQMQVSRLLTGSLARLRAGAGCDPQ